MIFPFQQARSLQVQQLVLVHAWSLDLAWSWSSSNAKEGGRNSPLIHNICFYIIILIIIIISNAYSVTGALFVWACRFPSGPSGYGHIALYLWIGFRNRLHLVIGVCEPVASCDVGSISHACLATNACGLVGNRPHVTAGLAAFTQTLIPKLLLINEFS